MRPSRSPRARRPTLTPHRRRHLAALPGTRPASGPLRGSGLLYRVACGGWRVDPLKAELGPAAWDGDVRNWLERARRGLGVTGPLDSTTAYFWGRSGWGGPLVGPCPKPKPKPPPEKPGEAPVPPGHPPGPPPGPPGDGGGGDDHGGGGDGGGLTGMVPGIRPA